MKTDETTVSGKRRSASLASATIFNHGLAESVPHGPYVELFKVEILTILRSLFGKCFFFHWFCSLGKRNVAEWLWIDFSINNSAFPAPLGLRCMFFVWQQTWEVMHFSDFFIFICQSVMLHCLFINLTCCSPTQNGLQTGCTLTFYKRRSSDAQ